MRAASQQDASSCQEQAQQSWSCSRMRHVVGMLLVVLLPPPAASCELVVLARLCVFAGWELSK